jgi:hypothetical protein
MSMSDPTPLIITFRRPNFSNQFLGSDFFAVSYSKTALGFTIKYWQNDNLMSA